MIEGVLIGLAVIVGVASVCGFMAAFVAVMIHRLARGDFGDPTDLTE